MSQTEPNVPPPVESGCGCFAAFVLSFVLFFGMVFGSALKVETYNRWHSARDSYFTKELTWAERQQLGPEVLRLRRANEQMAVLLNVTESFALCLVVGGAMVALSRKTPVGGIPRFWRWLGVTSPAVLVSVGVFFEIVHRLWKKQEQFLFHSLGSYAVVVSAALVIGSLYVCIAWRGRAAKFAALFAFLTAFPLSIWGMKWMLRALEILKADPDFDRTMFSRSVAGLAAVLGGATLCFGVAALWKQRYPREPLPAAPDASADRNAKRERVAECWLMCPCGEEIGIELCQAGTEVVCSRCGKPLVAPLGLAIGGRIAVGETSEAIHTETRVCREERP